jgi:probable F420-dependent oxidoreductase
MELRGTGVWSGELRFGDQTEAATSAAELEHLGYTSAWIPDVGGDLFGPFDNLLGATSTMTIASGIMNVWRHTPEEAGEWFTGLPDDRRARVLLGIGISHAPFIEEYKSPLATISAFLDGMDAAGIPEPHRCIAALGPKMLELARDRTAGSHPYLVNPEHTAQARAILGDKGLFVEQGVVLETDADKARAIARNAVSIYTTLPNYVNNWKRLGYTENEILNTSDRFIDEIFVWGDADAIGERIAAHHAAGADHVCIQALSAEGVPAIDTWRALAPAR